MSIGNFFLKRQLKDSFGGAMFFDVLIFSSDIPDDFQDKTSFMSVFVSKYLFCSLKYK